MTPMLGRPKPVTFDPYGSRRKRRGLPRWLVLLLLGAAVGAGGVIYVQERHLPPRLSAQESVRLRGAFEQAETERVRLKGALAATEQKLATALTEKKSLTDDLTGSRASVERLRADNVGLVGALPPDPRGGPVAVRAGSFTVEGGQLAYDVVFSRDRGSKPFTGVVVFIVAGLPASGGPETTVTSKPVPLAVNPYENLRGKLPLPEGFRPRQATIQVLDRVDGRPMGMRVMYVK